MQALPGSHKQGFFENLLKWMEVMDLRISSSKSHSKTMGLAAAGLGKAA
jgi:hypothetical protein